MARALAAAGAASHLGPRHENVLQHLHVALFTKLLAPRQRLAVVARALGIQHNPELGLEGGRQCRGGDDGPAAAYCQRRPRAVMAKLMATRECNAGLEAKDGRREKMASGEDDRRGGVCVVCVCFCV